MLENLRRARIKMIAEVGFGLFAITAILALVFWAAVGTSTARQQTSDTFITRYVDQEAGVVCWVFEKDIVTIGGISCLPIEQTLLQKGGR